MGRFHPEVLTRGQAGALRHLGPILSAEGFYLGGGTAVAIQLGHRRSNDCDWFKDQPVGDALVLASRLRQRGVPLIVQEVAPGTLHGRVGSVRLSCLEYRYPLLGDPVSWADCSCQIASLDDLACMKLAAVAQRGAKKDFVDIYALGAKHRPLPDLLQAYRRKYEVGDIAHVIYGLTYFDDADRQRMPVLLWDLDWRRVKQAIRGWIRELAGIQNQE